MTDKFTPDWELDLAGKIAVALTLSLNTHIPCWPGATDEQLAAVAADIRCACRHIPTSSRLSTGSASR